MAADERWMFAQITQVRDCAERGVLTATCAQHAACDNVFFSHASPRGQAERSYCRIPAAATMLSPLLTPTTCHILGERISCWTFRSGELEQSLRTSLITLTDGNGRGAPATLFLPPYPGAFPHRRELSTSDASDKLAKDALRAAWDPSVGDFVYFQDHDGREQGVPAHFTSFLPMDTVS
jgi:hypothetical protein